MQAKGERGGPADVVLVGSYPPPHGGQSVHIENLHDFLQRRGMRVAGYNTGTNKHVAKLGVTNITSTRNLLSTLISATTYKLVHVHVATGEDHGKLLPVALAAAVRRVPWIATIHSGASADSMRRARPLQRRVSRSVLSRAASIVCVNQSIQADMIALLGPRSPIVIPPFSFTYRASAMDASLEEFLAGHSPVISCVGFYEPTYGFEDAVRMLKVVRENHPTAGLLLMGDRSGSGSCETLIGELDLVEHVRLCDNLEHQECLEIMARSALFLRPTRYDGDSISVREALLLGVPVVASATAFRPEGVLQYKTGDFGDLVEKTLTALTLRRGASPVPKDVNDNMELVHRLYLNILQGH